MHPTNWPSSNKFPNTLYRSRQLEKKSQRINNDIGIESLYLDSKFRNLSKM